MFYVFSNVNGVGLQVFRSKSIRGPWERNQLPGRHDLSVLFDDDGKVYIISGNRSPYPIEQLTPDLRSFVPGVRYELDAPMGEGHHLYKINGKGAVAPVTGFWAELTVPGRSEYGSEKCYWRKKASRPQ
jgi:beta-xylosidase